MGANTVNTMAEAVAPRLETITIGKFIYELFQTLPFIAKLKQLQYGPLIFGGRRDS